MYNSLYWTSPRDIMTEVSYTKLNPEITAAPSTQAG